jgi:hypothetical protein
MLNSFYLQLILFAGIWAIGIYTLNCLLAREIKQVNFIQAALHILTMAMIGLLGEIFVGSVYQFLFDKPLWNYTTFPIHDSYTSQYAIILWGIYGLHLYLLHGTLKKKKIENVHKLALVFCLEAIVIELLVNITYKLSFGDYIYYYFPSDLWHYTSIQALPFYYLGGYVIIHTFKRFETDAKFFSLMSLGVIVTLAFLT